MRKSLRMMMLFLLLTQTLMAQMDVTGTVTDEKKNPLSGVTVSLKGTQVKTQTDPAGVFKIKTQKDKSDLIFSYVGYQSQTIAATSGDLSISLMLDDSKLSEVVVIGLAGSIKRSNVANSVATIDAKTLTGITRPPTLDGAMNGKIAGAQISANSGAPGGGTSIRLRGISSVVGSSEPLFVVDGVIVNNDQFPTGAGTGAFNGATGANAGTQDQAPNRISDINPADIESLNILKGPSAAAIYGSRANAGVVVITTKRGKSGRTKITISQDLGFSEASKLLGSSNWDAAKINTYGGAYGMSVAEATAALTAANGKTWDHEKIIFGNKGFINNTNFSVSGGNDKTRFYVSGSLQNEDGIVRNTGFNRKSIRVNLDHRLSSWVDFKVSSSYLNSYSSRSFTGNDNNGVSLLYSLAYIPNFLDLERKADGTYPNTLPTGQNPYEIVDKAENIERTNRFMNSGELNFQILNTDKHDLKLSFKGGVDYMLSEPRAYVPEDVQYQSRRANPGASRYATNKALYTYFQSSLVYNTTVGNNINLATTASLLRDEQNREISWIQGTGLLPGQRNPSTAQVRLTESQVQKETVVAFDLGQDVNWDDKIIGRVGIRADKSTLAGLNFEKMYYFPRGSLAINLTNFSFWKVKEITQLKPRIAYGETSGFPAFNGVYSQLLGLNYGGLLGSVSPTTLGLSSLDPERASELEFGLDLSLFQNRITIEATYYKKQIKDFLFGYTLAPASGVNSFSVYPIGDLENRGVEIGINATVVKNKNIEWNTGIQWWTNKTEVTRLSVPPAFVPGSGFGAYGRKRLQLGTSPTAWWGFDTSGALVPFKDYQPDFQMSWSNSLRIGAGFEINMLWHTSQGNHNSSLTRLTKDEGGTTDDWSNIGKSGDPIGVERQNTIINNFIFDASYIRLREVAAYYSLPKSIISSLFKDKIDGIRVGISAQNLVTITNYYGYDPESSNFVTSGVGGGGALVGGVDLGPFPAVRRFFFHLNVNF
jgi:TonB-linked SusC/RagA family outer membrane protein